MPAQRLVLLGGGHAHVQVVRAFAAARPPNTAVTLVSEARLTPYSGMLPGLVAGHYRYEEAHIDLAALCEAAGVAFVQAHVGSIDLARGGLETDAVTSLKYDILSIDTGSITPIQDMPGAAEHAVPVKPADRFLRAIEAVIARTSIDAIGSIAVIGGGAAGFEIATAIDCRLQHSLTDRARPDLHLCTDTPCILPAFPARTRKFAERILDHRDIALHTCARVEAIDSSGITFAEGSRLAADAVFLVTGAAPSAMFRQCGLSTDERGFVQVHATLQSVSHPEVFACGDVTAVTAHPRPKAGVFAVRQGPPLADNLRRALCGTTLRPFVPQHEFLVLLGTGYKHAIAVRNGFTLQGAWVWRWKDRIDRRFMAGFAADAVRKLRR